MLAEVDLSRGRYEDAIARYERLVRRGGNDAAARRLEQIKLQYAEANMPLQFKRAVEDESITRADLAVLMYWKVSSVRFAQSLPEKGHLLCKVRFIDEAVRPQRLHEFVLGKHAAAIAKQQYKKVICLRREGNRSVFSQKGMLIQV